MSNHTDATSSQSEIRFPLQLTLRLDWSEMDLFGHINNVQYFKFIQAARVNLWEQIGSMIRLWEQRIGPSLASTGCQFRKPLFYPGSVVVESRVGFVKTTSFGIHHRIRDAAGDLCAESHDVVVLFDFNANIKVPIPEDMREEMSGLGVRGS